jgi:hypothetical protein
VRGLYGASAGLRASALHSMRQACVTRRALCTFPVQGILHMGKGLLSLHPFHGHRTLLSPVALSGILAVMTACLDFPVRVA